MFRFVIFSPPGICAHLLLLVEGVIFFDASGSFSLLPHLEIIDSLGANLFYATDDFYGDAFLRRFHRTRAMSIGRFFGID